LSLPALLDIVPEVSRPIHAPFLLDSANVLPKDGLESAEPIRINSTHGDIELFPKPLPDGIGWYPKGQGPDTGTEQKDARVQAGGIDEPLNGFKIKLTMGNKKHHVGQHKGAGM
jgi:hypothetical protein